ncbi:microsomal signal peptidase 25 kDa subunit-domain-containing protein [Fomitopsis serialis]|uniref:microsomal signal peptidase 25 kDa subunit-domain-containing protein n=1 Tax=Fomitopsis serialis TaxID=139415 RepID=UPI002007B4EB|nr:microsomal signal peptidase 25 kDa subunit-domain-containing protein [Neoantrodia serialis]KAH9932927.1 microsomal signal peptidase 25 kDa subunit-domain-containing protein [Neoantrodia serialis]
MAPRNRKAENGESSLSAGARSKAAATPEPSVDGNLASALLPSTEVRDVVKVNNASVTEMKHACDDALKRFLSRPELFNQIYTHTDVRLGLGWASVFVALGTGLYSWKVDFEKSKPAVWAGVILYVLLTTIQTLYAYFIEGDIVFVGKRKTFDKRIVTERITLTSTSTPSKPTSPPAYSLGLTYMRSTSGGKSLLGRGRAKGDRGYNTFFDEKGVMDQEGFERWVGEMVGRVMEGKNE